jgi:hypothetical protein
MIAELRLLSDSGCKISDYESLIECCSSSISELPRSSLSEMSVDLLHGILSHHSLELPSEDWLYGFVKEQVTRNTCYSILLELIRYEYLSIELIHDFTTLICQSFDFLTYPLWLSLIRRLTLSVSPPAMNDRTKMVFVPGDCGELNGILSFLSREFGGNLHDQGIVIVSASSQNWSDCPARVIVDFNSSLKGFATNNELNSWICIEFKHHQIKPTHYSIRTRTDINFHHPRSWIVEGLSVDGAWVTLDSQSGNSSLNNVNTVRTFSIRNVCEVRSVRLRQTGLDSSNYNHLVLKSIEFFGELGALPFLV